MTLVHYFCSDQLVQEILSAVDLKHFVRIRADQLCVADVARLKSMVDQLATMDFKLASRLAEAVWEIGHQRSDDASRAYAEAALGRVEYCHGSYSQALTHYQKALVLMERTGQAVEVAILQKQLVGALMYLGKHQEALMLSRCARRVLKADNQQEHLAELETNIGNLYCYLLNQYRRALGYYERARTIFTRLGNEISCARVEYNLANAHAELEHIDEAICYYHNASRVYHEHEMFVYAAQADQYIASLLFRRGQFNEALKCYYQVREIQQQLDDKVSVAFCNLDMAELYLQLSVFEESARLAKAAQASFLQFENTFKAAWAQMLGGLAFAGLGEFERARRELCAALEEFSRQSSRVMVALVHNYLADLELKTGNCQMALAHAQEAERILVRERLSVKAASVRLILAKLAYLTTDLPRARRLLRVVQQQAQKHAVPWLEYECYYLRGCLQAAAGENDAALDQFARAIELVGRTRRLLSADELKSAFLRDKMDLFERTIELALELSDAGAQALRYIEQAKSHSLAELLAHYMQREMAEQLVPQELRERFRTLLNELNWYATATTGREEELSIKRSYSATYIRERRRRCEEELAEIFRRIQIEHASYAELQQAESIELPQLQRMLAPNEALLEYFSVRGRISAFTITSEGVTAWRDLISLAKVEELQQGFQFQLEKFLLSPSYIDYYLPRLRDMINEYLYALQARLIAPLANAIAGKALTIVPHGLLHYIPFHALYDGEQYLVERHEISYAPSMTVYGLCCRRQSTSTGSLLVFGLPDTAAPEIVHEVAEIAALYPDAQVLTEREASLTNLKRYGPQCRILHMATHGVVRPDNPLFSYLQLADGPMTFYNTFDLKLAAELVTLSACHTGVNRIFPGDELHGLMRGFLYAGTPTMLVSLWAADDRATTELMVSFYRHLSTGMGKRAALSAAQRELLIRRPHPYYWASFVLMGKP
ncbi:MAG: CHAT domain-containing tetratricopeptide repeat protein [Acidobacteriota bacterium]